MLLMILNRCRLKIVMNKFGIILIVAICFSCKNQEQNRYTIDDDDMMIRIAEIEIEPDYLDEYKSILEEESRASVKLEPGVISIFPMFQKENPTEIKILEIYRDSSAYKAHLDSPHFKKYKSETSKMVKSLRLIDMHTIDPETMPTIFRKIYDKNSR